MICSVSSCSRARYCKGYCEPHYRRVKDHGDPLADVPIGDLQKKPPQLCVCVICSAEFVRTKHSTGRYCSRRCAWEGRGGAAFSAAISRGSVQKRGDALRGRGEGRTYRKLNGRHEHRVVAEQKLGRALLPGEIVHHIDGDKLNNHPDNLEVMTQAEHIRIHKPSRWERAA